MTVLFQDSNGGLELKDAATGEYLHAQPEENAFVLNVGDMFQRLTNGTISQCLKLVEFSQQVLICL